MGYKTNMAKRKRDPVRHCRYCKSKLRRKVFGNGRLEDLGVFVKRKYCDQLCMAQGMIKPDVGKAQHHHRARKYRKKYCERCGSRHDLHAHHKDEDYTNDSEENIETVCGKCHGKEHGKKRGEAFALRQWMLKTDLGEIWVACRNALEELEKSNPQLADPIRNILHKHGQL